MADAQYDSLNLVGRHLPDESIEVQPDGSKLAVPLPGMYQVGVQFGHAFVPIFTFKASDYELPGKGQSDEAPPPEG
jgi:hypothetical protein